MPRTSRIERAERFPQRVYVTREGDPGEDEYLTAHAEQPEPDETVPCAIYELVQVGELQVTREFVTPAFSAAVSR